MTLSVLRLLLAAAICAACLGGWALVRKIVLSRTSRAAAGLPAFLPGLPGILYFTTPDCITCRAAQRPALTDLQKQLDGGVQVIEIDAVERPDLARRWSVLSVPTTFILDRDGRTRQVNHGFASTAKLRSQLQKV